MLRDTLKEYGQSNLVLLTPPDYPELKLLEYRLKCCIFIIVEELLSTGRK